MEIEHVGDENHLTLTEPNDTRLCEYCSRLISSCWELNYSVHKSCGMIPEEFQNPFHAHPLTLTPASADSRIRCDSCLDRCLDFTYRCNLCDFVVDPKCAFYMPTIPADKQLQHAAHFHPLKLVNDYKWQDYKGISHGCVVCGETCYGTIFCCMTCEFYIHKSCAELQFPQEIQHFFHPCSLAFNNKKYGVTCRACNNYLVGFSYECKECDFELDVECALLPNTIESGSEEKLLLHPFIHGHPLKLEVKKECDQVQCSVCEKRCSGQTYVCDRCEFFLHKSCVGLAPEIRHPFHPNHSLTLYLKSRNSRPTCNACFIFCQGFTYRCVECCFNLHIGCVNELMPTIKYEGHDSHFLTFSDKVNGYGIRCSLCRVFCKESPVFRCVPCDFNLHLLCGPLPCTIKDKCHIHPLTLTDSPIEDVDWNGFCCDVCENERDPRPSVYYCEECNYVAEITCVISEVILALKGEYGDAELRTSSRQITGKLVSKNNKKEQKEQAEIKTTALKLRDLLKSFTEDENLELNSALEAALKEPARTRRKMLSDDQKEDNDSIPEVLSLFSDEFYIHFMERLEYSGPKDYIMLWEENEEIVAVGDYMVTRSLAPILKELYAKYGNISADSMLTPRVKIYFNVMLCGTIDSMLKTEVEGGLIENLLFIWLKYLTTLQFVGFKIQFALDHWKRVVHAFLGIHIRRRTRKAFVRLDTDITKMSDEMEDLTIKLEAMKTGIERLKEEQKLLRSAESAKSNLIEECLTEASIFKGGTAGEGLL